jgi:hypothetical protein
MEPVTLILWLAGTGMTFKPVWVETPSMERCVTLADTARGRGHKARCLSGFKVRPCANCGAPSGPTG